MESTSIRPSDHTHAHPGASGTARTLTMVCQLSDDRAYDVMMMAHRHGSAVVGEYTKDVAESYCEGLRAAGIGCDVTKADSPE